MFYRTIVLIILVLSTSEAQSYLGYTTKNVNLREKAAIESNKITTLKSGTPLFVVNLRDENEFYNVIVIETNIEGFVHKSFVEIEEELKANEDGIFNPQSESLDYNPELEIFNNTSLTMTLKLNQISYTFSPKEKRQLNLIPGKYDYRASAPGVIPDYGVDTLKSNMIYEWEFYIITR